MSSADECKAQGNAAFKEGRLDEALACQGGAHAASEDELTEMTFLLGVAYQKSGREERALDAFERVLKSTDGEHWRARFHMALLSVSNGWFDQAASLLTVVLEQHPGHAQAAELLSKLRERSDAVQNKLVPPDDDNGR